MSTAIRMCTWQSFEVHPAAQC